MTSGLDGVSNSGSSLTGNAEVDDARDSEPTANVSSCIDGEDRLPELQQCEDVRPLAEGVGAVSLAVEALKARLEKSSHLNEALQSDLKESHERAGILTEERDRLTSRIVRMEEEASCVDDVQKELAQLRRERDALSRKVHDLVQTLAASEQRVQELGRLVDTIRAERNSATEEAAALETQFSRAMRIVAELKGQLTVQQTRAREQQQQIQLLHERLEATAGQRDSLQDELRESHDTLEQIRESFLAASRGGGFSDT